MSEANIKHDRSSETFEACVIVCVYLPGGVKPEQGYQMRDILNRLDTDGWWFLNPAMFIIAFHHSRNGLDRAHRCMAALNELPRAVAVLAEVAVGAAQGEVLCNLSAEGHLETAPLGQVVNEAFNQAKKNAR